jgi:hypothetical protein
MITSNGARDPLARIGELMDSDHSSLVTVVLDTQAVTYPARAVGDFVAIHSATLLDLAGGAIRRHRVADPAFGAADALQEALLMTLEAMNTYSWNTSGLSDATGISGSSTSNLTFSFLQHQRPAARRHRPARPSGQCHDSRHRRLPLHDDGR